MCEVIDHHGGELDSTLVVEAARQVVVTITRKTGKHIGAENNSYALQAA
jgi:hypothetical protein